MSYCEGQPKATEDDESSVAFINDTVNNKIDVKINGVHFTSYLYDKSLPKPVLFPLITSSEKTLTRGFPIDPKPGERVDHPHHMGHWFNYGDVNGLDFWNNSNAIPKEKIQDYGKIVHAEIVNINHEKGSIETKSEWQTINGDPILKKIQFLVFHKKVTQGSLKEKQF
jgi:hypothetical protein